MATNWTKKNYTFTDEYYEIEVGAYRATISLNHDYGYMLGIEDLTGKTVLTPNGMIDAGIYHDFKNLKNLQKTAIRLLNKYNKSYQAKIAA